MFLTSRVIRLISRQVVRAEEGTPEENTTGLQIAALLAKALAIAGVAYGVYWAAKRVLGPVAEAVGNEYPDLEGYPVIGPVLKALGRPMYDPESGLGSVADAEATEPGQMQTTQPAEAPAVVGQAASAVQVLPPAPAAGAPEATPYTPVLMPKPKVLSAGRQLAGVSAGEAFMLRNPSMFLSNEERASFEYLRTQHVNFNIGRGIPPALLTLIQDTAKRYAADGVRADWMLAMAQMESGGNPYAISSTGAIGIYQFINSTGKDYKMKNRFDQVENVDAGARLMRDNIKWLKPRLEKLGVAVDLNSIYLAHQQGRGGAIQLYEAAAGKSKLSAKMLKAMDLNYRGITDAQQYIDRNKVLITSKAKQSQQIDGWTNYVALDPTKTSTQVAQITPVAPVPAVSKASSTQSAPPAATPPAALPTTKKVSQGQFILAPGNILLRAPT